MYYFHPPKVSAAIDLGYGHVKSAIKVGEQIRTDTFPSYVGIASSPASMAGLAGFAELDVIEVDVRGRRFLVGPDSPKTRTINAERNRDSSYAATDQYMALMLGMLHRMRLSEIDVLVVGLPMNTIEANAAQLRERLTGRLDVPGFDRRIGGTTTVVVREVIVLGQPVGALLDASSRDPDLQRKTTIVLDWGWNTLDILGIEGGKPRKDRITAFQGGVAGYIDEVAKSVNAWVRQKHPNVREKLRLSAHLYEEALRTGKELETSLGPIDLKPHAKAASAMVDQCFDQVAAILGEDTGSITAAVLAGGGTELVNAEAHFRRRFPLITNVIVPDDPQFSVVRGFLAAGLKRLQALQAQHNAITA